jgi:endonuclease YncB( thermonuclease family)
MRSVAAVSIVLALAGCGSSGSEPSLEPEPTDAADDAADVAVDAFVPSGCPAPQRLGPTELPPGYLPAERVNLNYDVDGDTAHFYFVSGDHIVRYLYVNTEESGGANTTAFGKVAKATMAKWLAEAKELKIAVRSKGGVPETDMYGRWLALVFADGELLQTRMIREGLTAYYTSFGCAPSPLHEAFVYAEAEANANKRGIWAPGHPTDYKAVLADWIGTRKCRPNPYEAPYCPK